MEGSKVKLGIVVPCYNEEDVLPISSTKLIQICEKMISAGKIAESSMILFVDDGSKDETWNLINKMGENCSMIKGLKLAKNSGHQNALISGMFYINPYVDAVVSIDADLQDDICAIEEMVDKYKEGCDIVYGVRNNRETDSIFKRGTARFFYRFMQFMGADVVDNHADYRLMSQRAVSQLEKYEERNLFLRGIVPLIGFKSDVVYYRRGKRAAGESKYPLRKMIAFAVDGITSFSIRPLVYISILGFLCVAASVVAIIYILYHALVLHAALETGWASMIVSIWFLGGVQLLSLGVVGIYVGKSYMEVKKRPRYHIEKYTDSDLEDGLEEKESETHCG